MLVCLPYKNPVHHSMIFVARYCQSMFRMRAIRRRRWMLCFCFIPPSACSTNMKHLCCLADDLPRVIVGMLTISVLIFITIHNPFLCVTTIMLIVPASTLITWAVSPLLVVFLSDREWHEHLLFEFWITAPHCMLPFSISDRIAAWKFRMACHW